MTKRSFASLWAESMIFAPELVELIYLPISLKRLQMPGFSAQFDVDALRQAFTEATSQAARTEAVKDGLATTIVGLYEGLSEWYRRVGEGRVETIKAVIEAERATRDVSGIIIFDNARRINWKKGLAAPGYEGASGLYAQLLGDERFTPYAVLPTNNTCPITSSIHCRHASPPLSRKR